MIVFSYFIIHMNFVSETQSVWLEIFSVTNNHTYTAIEFAYTLQRHDLSSTSLEHFIYICITWIYWGIYKYRNIEFVQIQNIYSWPAQHEIGEKHTFLSDRL